MSKLKSRILAASCFAAVGSLGFVADALAASSDIYGGGSSLVAPYLRQAMDCYGQPIDLIFKGTPPTFQTVTPFDYTGTPAQDCSTTHTTTKTLHYISTGSGTGIAGIFSHDPTKYGFVDAGQTQYYPEVHYGVSDAGLAAADVGIYNGGGTEQGVTVVAPGVTATPPQYPNPAQLYGPMIQFPLSIDPVAITYDPVYKKVYNGDGSVTSYRFHIKTPRADGSGGLHLDAATYCKIFTGQITNWNDPALKALNGNASLKDPADTSAFSVPLQIVGRSDSSGTTSIFTRHLAAVCGSPDYVDGNTTLPSALTGAGVYDKTQDNTPAPGEVAGKYTVAAGSDGISKYVAFTRTPDSITTTIIQGRVGYVGPDYALPAVLSTNTNSYGLNTASLKNVQGAFVAPTAAAAVKSFGAISPPQSDASGHYDSSVTANGLRANPQDWVQGLSHTSVLANPPTTGAYPIVGTTNFIGYTCYKTSAQKATLTGFLGAFYGTAIYTDQKKGILASAGLAPLPTAWHQAIKETFVNNSSGLGLNISLKGSGAACSVSGIVGG